MSVISDAVLSTLMSGKGKALFAVALAIQFLSLQGLDLFLLPGRAAAFVGSQGLLCVITAPDPGQIAQVEPAGDHSHTLVVQAHQHSSGSPSANAHVHENATPHQHTGSTDPSVPFIHCSYPTDSHQPAAAFPFLPEAAKTLNVALRESRAEPLSQKPLVRWDTRPSTPPPQSSQV